MLSKRRFVSTGCEPKTKTKSIHFTASSYRKCSCSRAAARRRACGKFKKSLKTSGDSCILRRPLLSFSNHKGTRHEHKQAGRAGSASARNTEALQASGARSLMELLAES